MGWHGKPLSEELAQKAIQQLKIKFREESKFKPSAAYIPKKPADMQIKHAKLVQTDLAQDANKKYFEKNNTTPVCKTSIVLFFGGCRAGWLTKHRLLGAEFVQELG